MKLAAAVAMVLPLFVVLAARDQDKPGARTGVLNLREALDKARNNWIAEIEAEVQKLQDAESGRASDLNPQERARIRAKVNDLSNKRRLEVYNELVRISGVIAKERGFDVIQRVDRMPALEPGELDLSAQIDRRGIVHFDPSIDITGDVVERLNREHAARKK